MITAVRFIVGLAALVVWAVLAVVTVLLESALRAVTRLRRRLAGRITAEEDAEDREVAAGRRFR